jgi:hypothetical protein
MDLDEVVRANIKDVLDSVARSSIAEQAKDTCAPSSSQQAAPPRYCVLDEGCLHQLTKAAKATSLADTSPLHCRDGTWLDPNILEVPQNSDATIRLLKARIKSLEEQLNTALTLNQGVSEAQPAHGLYDM